MEADARTNPTRVIWTCFAGRQRNLQIMMRYVTHLLNAGHVAECHLWNFTRVPEDEKWLKTLYANSRDKRIRLMHVQNKALWTEYYKYYTRARFPNHVIIKCDDDIIYVDVNAFPRFIEHRIKLKNHLLMFANIVNNGVCAFYQQASGLLPADKIGAALPFDTTYGKLWSDGQLAERVHDCFIRNETEWTKRSHTFPVREYPLGNRISINFFAILSKDLDIFQLVRSDDEIELSYAIPLFMKRPNCIDLSFFVSHLSFYKQRDPDNCLDETRLLREYHQIAHKKGVAPFKA